MYGELAIVTLFAFCYSLVSGRLERSVISGPMVFVAAGFLMGPFVLGWFDNGITRTELRTLADCTLALVLFCDAANADLRTLRHQIQIPARMLLLGLPGVILLGSLLALVLFTSLTIFEAAILGTMLAATDAALGKAVVTNKIVPARLREGLNIESGLNDGLCVPILFVFIALAEGSVAAEGGVSAMALHLVAEELGIGLLVGLAITFLGAWIFRFFYSRGWVTEIWMQTTVVSLALSCFFIAQSFHGSGYIAAFTGGLLFGYLARDATHKLILAGEGLSEILALLTWMLFGSVVIGAAIAEFTWAMIIYALLSLTLVRMVPICLSLAGSGEKSPAKLFLGWFGPRGLASIVFAVIVVEKELPGSHFIAMTVVCTVVLSLILHGVTAQPLAKWIGGKEKG